jgi:hypothetical protein
MIVSLSLEKVAQKKWLEELVLDFRPEQFKTMIANGVVQHQRKMT